MSRNKKQHTLPFLALFAGAQRTAQLFLSSILNLKIKHHASKACLITITLEPTITPSRKKIS